MDDTSRKPDPKEDHKGCIIHDTVCIDEQMKALCTVKIFICFNCRFMMLNSEEFREMEKMTASFVNLLFGA